MKKLNSEGRYVPESIAKTFGENLEKVFGPIEDREVNLYSFAYDDEGIDEIIKQLPNKGIINTRKLFGKSHKNIEDNPSIIQIFNEVLETLRFSGALLGYSLPVLDLDQERKGLMQLPWDVFVIRPDVNRELNIGHILKNIIRKWDIRYNDPVFARITTKDGSPISEDNWEEHLANNNLVAVINDHQHGGIGRFGMGAPYALVDPIFCNKKSTDSEMYHKRNGTMLQATWEQQARNSMAVVRDKLAEPGGARIHEADQAIYDWGQLLHGLGVDFQSSSLPKDKGVCNRGKDLYKHYNTRKYRSFYGESIELIRDVWPEGELTVEVLWAVLTIQAFYKETHNYTNARLKELRKIISTILKAYYPDEMYGKNYRNRATTSAGNKDPNKRTLWGDTNSYRSYLETKDGDDWRIKLDRGLMMASTIHHMIMSYNKYLVETGKKAIVNHLSPVTTGSGKSIDFKNPFRIYKDSDMVAEYDWSATDEVVDYSNFETEEEYV